MAGWIRMNGSVGCMPDSCEVYETKEDAIDATTDMFDDLSEDELNDMYDALTETGIHYFTDPSEAGADYVSVEYGPEAEPDVIDLTCDQCCAAMINGVYCHETGCPNMHKVKVDGEWIVPEAEDKVRDRLSEPLRQLRITHSPESDE
jgi:hypothetical protein